VISTRDLSLLPGVDDLRRTLQAMAMLDAILCPEWQFRYYSFNATWAPGEQMGSMRNGSGDDLFAHFSAIGCLLKGFAHEYPMTPYREDPPRVWPDVLDAVPSEFAACMREPAFEVENVTFCVWRRYIDPHWQIGPVKFPTDDSDPDGSEFLLSALDGRPESYQEWAMGYYELEIPLASVKHVYCHRPLGRDVIASLHSKMLLSELAADIKEIGYPS
jgi:hypothetical protein